MALNCIEFDYESVVAPSEIVEFLRAGNVNDIMTSLRIATFDAHYYEDTSKLHEPREGSGGTSSAGLRLHRLQQFAFKSNSRR